MQFYTSLHQIQADYPGAAKIDVNREALPAGQGGLFQSPDVREMFRPNGEVIVWADDEPVGWMPGWAAPEGHTRTWT